MLPSDLGEAGTAVWRDIWSDCGWLTCADVAMVEAVARAEDEAAQWRDALNTHGVLLEEPIVTPRGEVVGSRLVANPAAAELRRVERTVREYRQVLGLTPASRARLGVDVARLRAAAEVEAVARRESAMTGYRQAAGRKTRGSGS